MNYNTYATDIYFGKLPHTDGVPFHWGPEEPSEEMSEDELKAYEAEIATWGPEEWARFEKEWQAAEALEA